MSLSTNHFQVFNLPVSFDIDKDLLTQRYRDLQRSAHPDNYVNAAEQERLLAIRHSADINEAFQTLKNPLTRGRYLLQLQGVSHQDENQHMLDNDFLLEQMELHEELTNIPSQKQPITALNHFLAQIDQQVQELTRSLSQQFSQQNWHAAQIIIQKLNFFKRIHEEAIALEEKLV